MGVDGLRILAVLFVRRLDMRCLDFPNDWRPLKLYYIKYENGSVRLVWAHDMVDMLDALGRENVIEYGSV